MLPPISVRKDMVMPSAYRFIPSDLSLVRSFLHRKIANLSLPHHAIFAFDVYGTQPWNVPEVYGPGELMEKTPWFRKEPKKIVKEGYKGYYFVPPRTEKKRKLHTVIECGDGGGYWKKVNHGPRDVLDETNKVVGLKTTFVFYRYTDEKKDHAERTDWILNEYSLNSEKFQPWVLCSVRNKLEYSKAYFLSDDEDEDEEFLKQDEVVTKLIDRVEEADIQNASTKQIEELVTKLMEGVEEVDIQNASTKQFENACRQRSDVMEEED